MPTVRQKARRRANRKLKKDPPREPTRSNFPSFKELVVWRIPIGGIEAALRLIKSGKD